MHESSETLQFTRRNVRAQTDQAVAQVNVALAQMRAAELAVKVTAANLRAAQVAVRKAGLDDQRLEALYVNDEVTRQQVDDARAAVETARDQRDALAAQLAEQRASATAAHHAAEQARGSYEVARSNVPNIAARRSAFFTSRFQVEEARAAVGVARASESSIRQREQQLQEAVAAQKEAEAALAVAQTHLQDATLVAPFDGTILSHSVEVGDLVNIGATVVTIADLKHPYVWLYVSEADIARVTLQQRADVTTDATGARVFHGVVDQIRNKAEYTPNNVQTKEERVKEVFGVRVLLDNSSGLLKPGLPVDAVIWAAPEAPSPSPAGTYR